MKHIYDFHHPFEVLRQADGQKVVFCYECQLFHVHFGTISLDLSEMGMKMLTNTLVDYLGVYDGGIDPNKRCVEVETPCQGIRLLLSTTDLRTFSELLKGSLSELEQRLRLRKLN
ncbi:MAG: hypothetical protein AAFP77_20680 [Bacteroidota bacterium]